MYTKIYGLFFLHLVVTITASAQLFPAEDASVNYRLVGFSFPGTQGVSDYMVEIAMGNYAANDVFLKNVVTTAHAATNRIIAEVPYFGRDYTWRSSYTSSGKTNYSKLHHFTSVISGEVDSPVTRLTIMKGAEKYKDAYVFADCSNALYNMDGKPVWYLPLKGKLVNKENKLMDMKLTPQGTVTFLIGQNIYEVNYNGDIIWEGPDNGKTTRDNNAHYHHEFTRLRNGHYMVLGNEFVKTGAAHSSNVNARKIDSTTAFGTVIEYDQKGRVMWKWRSADYFKTIPQQYLETDVYGPMSPQGTNDTHENAFYFDEQENMVYISFKNINSIIKVKYPEGKVVATYGKLSGVAGTETGRLFCGQHSCKAAAGGKFYIFNNNSCNKGAMPQVFVFDQPANAKDTLSLAWQFMCGFDDVLAQKKEEARAANTTIEYPTPEFLAAHSAFSRGGNVTPLPDGSLFVSICGPLGKMFIISPEKKVLWCALPETWNQYNKRWDDLIGYKANIVTNFADIQRFVWSALPKPPAKR